MGEALTTIANSLALQVLIGFMCCVGTLGIISAAGLWGMAVVRKAEVEAGIIREKGKVVQPEINT